MKYLTLLLVLLFPATAHATTWNTDMWQFHFHTRGTQIHVREVHGHFCTFTATQDLIQPTYIDYFANIRCDGVDFDATVIDWNDPDDEGMCSHEIILESPHVNITFQEPYRCG